HRPLQVDWHRRLGRRHGRPRNRARGEEEGREAFLRPLRAGTADDVVTQRTDQLRTVEEPLDLVRRAAVAHVRVVEDLRKRPTTLVLADHVRRNPVLVARTGEEEGEGIAEQGREPRHRGGLYPGPRRELSSAAG